MDIICKVCDGVMDVSNEMGKPMMLITGDVEMGNERLAVCRICGHREILKD